MAARQDGRPRHQQVAAHIRAQIISGEIRVDTKLPTIAVLAERYRTTNSTIQSALADLREEGFVRSQAGLGVFVRSRQPFVIRVAPYFTPTTRGYSYRLIQVAEVEPPADVAKVYNLGPGDTTILRQRLTLHNNEPVELSWAYYPMEIAGDTLLAGRAKIVGGAPQILAELGYPQVEFTDDVSARPPTTEEIEGLGLSNDVPVLRQFRIVYAAEQRPVEVSIGIKGGHLYVLRYRETIEQVLDG